jgi:hypothetical protein
MDAGREGGREGDLEVSLSRAALFQHEKDDLVEEPCPVLKPRLVFQDTARERFNTVRPLCNRRIRVLLQQVSAYVSMCQCVSVCVYV